MSGVHILSATVSEKAGRWFVSVQVEMDIPDPQPMEKPAAGVDLGINRMAQVSDGMYFENPHALKSALTKLKRLQRVVSPARRGVPTAGKLRDNWQKHMLVRRTSVKTLCIGLPACWRKPSRRLCWKT
jgi:transposase